MDTCIHLDKLSKTKCIDSFKTNVIFNAERVENLITFCTTSQIDANYCRPTAWKIALDVLDRTKPLSHWLETINKQRMEYKKKVKTYCSVKKFSGDPLGSVTKPTKKDNPSTNSNTWGIFHETNKLKDLINLDLSRTYQEIDLFTQVKVKNSLATVLFVWAKENEVPSYQQGMSDILGVFYIAFYPYYFKNPVKPKQTYQDIVSYLTSNEQALMHVDDIYTYFHDEDYLEADLYFVFDKMMQKGVKDLFNKATLSKTDPMYRRYELFPQDWKDESDEDVPSYVNRRCNLLVKEKLKRLDDELFTHFRRIDLVCGTFLQRWLRCAFSHEFDSKQIVVIWDAMFGNENVNEDKYPLIYMDYFALGMFFRIRKDLLNGEQNDCFSILFRYPKVERIEDLVSLANKVKEAIEDNLNGVNTLVYEVLFIPRPMSANCITPHMYNQAEMKKERRKEDVSGGSNSGGSGNNGNVGQSGSDENDGGFFGGKIMSSLGSFGGMIKEKVQQASEKIGEKIEQIKADKNINSFGEVISNFVGQNNQQQQQQQQLNDYEDNNGYNYDNNYNYNNNNSGSNEYDYNNSGNSGNNNSSNNVNEQNENITQMNTDDTNNYNNNTTTTTTNTTSDNNEYQIDSHSILSTLSRINTKYHLYMDVRDKKELRTIIQFFKDNITD